MLLKSILSIIGCICFCYAQCQISDTLKQVNILAKKDSILHLTVINSNVPHFIIDQHKLDELLAIDIGDALKLVPGVNIKDYGGIGGLKTISYRSLGSPHTSISIDGLILPMTQTGSLNLNQFDAFGTERIEMTSGQVQFPYASAANYLQSNVLTLESSLFSKNATKLAFKTMHYIASIGLIQHGASISYQPKEKWSYNIQGLYKYGNGNYPFVIQNIDSTYRSERTNAALNSVNIRGGIQYQHKITEIILKTTYHKNDQELPGAIILYNPFTDQNLKEELYNHSFQIRIRPKQYAIGIHGFVQDQNTTYTDNLFLNSEGLLKNQYHNRSFGSGFILNRFLKTEKQRVFFGVDYLNGHLHGDQFLESPMRQNLISVLGVSKWFEKIKLEGNLTHQFILDQTPTEKLKFSNFSPFISFGYLPFKLQQFRIRAHYKNTYRLPSFNDLYYNLIGNSNLKPEEADLFNIGLTYGKTIKYIKTEITLDAYRNKVFNKIIAIPTKNLFNWSMQNIGITKSTGIETNIFLALNKFKIKYTFSSSQAINSSVDITDISESNYGHQIPYTPIYTATYSFNANANQYTFGFNILYSGHRYVLNENQPSNYLPGFTDIGINGGKVITTKKAHQFKLNLQLANLLGNNYEVIKSFPMPGRHFKFKFIYQFKS